MVIKIIIRAGDEFFQDGVTIRSEGEIFEEAGLLGGESEREGGDKAGKGEVEFHGF